jgi:hypothetical protein
MSLTFREYLSTRRKRYTPLSAFLAKLIRDDDFAAISSREELDAYLARQDLEPNERSHAHTVWRGYLNAKKKRASNENV